MVEKTRENRSRRKAKRLGLEVRKSRARKPNVSDLGGYQIVTAKGRVVMGRRFDLSLTEVEDQLDELELELLLPELASEMLAHRAASKAVQEAVKKAVEDGAGEDQLKAIYDKVYLICVSTC